jgi:RNA exonuclease 4
MRHTRKKIRQKGHGGNNLNTNKSIKNHKPFTFKANTPAFVPRSIAPVVAPVAAPVAAPVTTSVPVSRNEMKHISDVMNSIALDCEMVGIGNNNMSVLAHVAISDFWGNQLYNEYVIPSTGINSITQYRTKWSGVTKSMLVEKGRPFEEVKEAVKSIIGDRIVVGHGLDNDFKVLEFRPEKHKIWDTVMLDEYKRPNGLPNSLKKLASRVAQNEIQQEKNKNGKPKSHSPLEDARAAMNIYRIHNKFPKIVYNNMADPNTVKYDQFKELAIMASRITGMPSGI